MLGLLRRVFSNCISVSAKCSLYISLVCSRLLYLSPVWHPYLLMDIKCLELVHRRSTKFIISNPLLDYKTCLINLDLLPLMMEFEIADILFLVKSLKSPSDNFNIHEHLQFCSHPTRACYNFKMNQPLSKSDFEQSFYFNRIPRQWNSLPPVDINLPVSVIKLKLRQYFRDHFISNFISDNVCTYTIYVLAPNVLNFQSKCILVCLHCKLNVVLLLSCVLCFVLCFVRLVAQCFQSFSTVLLYHSQSL